MCAYRYAELCPPLPNVADDVSISLGILKGADIEGFGTGRSKVIYNLLIHVFLISITWKSIFLKQFSSFLWLRFLLVL